VRVRFNRMTGDGGVGGSGSRSLLFFLCTFCSSFGIPTSFAADGYLVLSCLADIPPTSWFVFLFSPRKDDRGTFSIVILRSGEF